ncbi:MAG: hypothetical protein H0T60_07200 [Acidobacteria bacterium]|nr:hypothetical protein [Acidobacteriota bacterium]
MRRFFNIIALAALACFNSAAALGQTAQKLPPHAPAAQNHLIGEVTAVDAATGQLTVKWDTGEVFVVMTSEKTAYRRIPPGETELDKAEQITRADVSVGDRVLVPNGVSAGPGVAARQVIVMARSAIAEQRERNREERQRRSLIGRVTAVDAAKKELTVQARSREGLQTVTVVLGEGTRLLRFASGSIRPADARQGSFAELKVGDQLRATGERASDPTRFKAEEIISGTFARIGGKVSAVDAGRGEVTVKSEETGETFTVAVGKSSALKRVTREAAEAFGQRRAGRREERRAANGSTANGSEEGTRSGERRRERAARGEGQDGARPREGGGGGNLQQLLEGLPVLTLAELKKGDTVLVTGSIGADASRLTALMLLTGDAEFLRRLQRRVGEDLRNMSPGLPGSVLGGGTGSSSDQP